MIIINKDNLIEKVRHHGFKVALFYDGLSSQFDQERRPYFEKYKELDPESLVQRIEHFAKTYPGQFTVVLKHQEGSTAPARVAVRFDPAPAQNGGQTVLNGFTPGYETPEQMEDRILKKIKAQMTEQMLVHENQALKAKLQGLETTGGKLANMLEMWIQAKFMGQKVPALQGTPGDKKPHQKEVEEEEEELDQQTLKNALETLLELIGGENIILLANKLKREEDPTIINMVINYAKQ